MTEAEWLVCAEPERMLEWLDGQASNRKFLVFACACCRRIWDRIVDERSRKAVELTERHVDQPVLDPEFNAIFWDAQDATGDYEDPLPEMSPSEAVAYNAAEAAYSTLPEPLRPSDNARFNAVASAAYAAEASKFGTILESVAQASLLRDLFGNPFRPVTIDFAWLTWNNATVVELAKAIYDNRRFTDLPILGDALEEAGCAVPDILNHCRDPGEHCRGCWVVDVLLGKS